MLAAATTWATYRCNILRKRLVAFACERRAVALVEFAVAMPVLVIFMLGAGELARYVNVTRQLTNLANSYATMLAVRTTNLTLNDALFVFNSTVVTFPPLLKDAKRQGTTWQNDIQVTLSSVQMTKADSSCTSNCTYNAKVVWSLNSNTATPRSCVVAPLSAPDTDRPSLTTLPKDIFSPGSVLVADVVYTYTPVFGKQFIPTLTIRRSAYLQPRYVSTLHYTRSGFFDPFWECP